MENLSTIYAGIALKSPVIAGSSNLTNTAEKNKALEDAGVGAVVLKSLFEEQIAALSGNMLYGSDYPEAIDYIRNYVKGDQVNQYLNLIRESKSICTIPVIGSINCYSAASWTDFASEIQSAGADALELNLFSIDTGLYKENSQTTRYVEILKKIKQTVKIPIIVKVGKYSDNIPELAYCLYSNGAAAVVLFNKFHQPDIDVHALQITTGPVFSPEGSLGDTLRWTGIVSGLIPQIDIASSTGVYSWEDAVKCILAGASAVQVCSSVYTQGYSIISKINRGIKTWMKDMDFASISEYKGRLNSRNIPDPTLYERVQFMKYFSNRD